MHASVLSEEEQLCRILIHGSIRCLESLSLPQNEHFFLNVVDISKLMKNVAVCLVSCRWQRCPYQKETELSKWAMGAQAEALVPSTMCGIRFLGFYMCYSFLIHMESRWLYSIHTYWEVCNWCVRSTS